jgi:hypothetical protein
MTHHGSAMRALAEKYLRLAKTSHDGRERSKFIDYAMLYAQLSEQARRREGPASISDQPDREDHDVRRRYARRR